MQLSHRLAASTVQATIIAFAAVLLLAAPAAGRTGPVELGAAVGGPPFFGHPDPRYRQTLQLYDSLTAENEMKMYYTRRALMASTSPSATRWSPSPRLTAKRARAQARMVLRLEQHE